MAATAAATSLASEPAKKNIKSEHLK